MIFSATVLFIHVPKTGGMAVSERLLEILPLPVWYAHPGHAPEIESRGVIQIPGIRHETLDEAAEVVGRYGLEMAQFQCILAGVRNPYALEVSRFAYLKHGYPWDRGHNQELALAGDFERFAISSRNHRSKVTIEKYFLLNGKLPENLKVLRTEHLGADLGAALAPLGIHDARPLPRINRSLHPDPEHYYTRAAEEAVYERYRWIFDNGYYARLDSALFR